MQKITPCLWFHSGAENAAAFYASVFKDCTIVKTAYYGEGTPGEAGSVMTVLVSINGSELLLLNGGPSYTITPAVSLMINCKTQEEIDELWEKLPAHGGQVIQCGWLVDKFGVSWQVVPVQLGEFAGDPDPVKANRVMHAMLQMKKLVIQDLQDAYDGK